MSLAIDQTIEGKKIEQNQRKAILTSGENICVNAGAGSGKTFTILAKIIYILDQKLAKPEEIAIKRVEHTSDGMIVYYKESINPCIKRNM